MKALLVGCDMHTVLSIRLALQLRWPELAVITEMTRRKGLQTLRNLSPELVFVVVDPTPSDLDSLEFLQEARAVVSNAILMALSHHPSDTELTAALEAGADNYVSLPVNGPVLVARLMAILRRSRRQPEASQVSLAGGRLRLHPVTYKAYVDEHPVRLTPTEFRLLYRLAADKNHVVTHEALQDAIWGDEVAYSLYGLRKYIQRRRHKLKATLGDDVQIVSVSRVGYQLIDSAA